MFRLPFAALVVIAASTLMGCSTTPQTDAVTTSPDATPTAAQTADTPAQHTTARHDSDNENPTATPTATEIVDPTLFAADDNGIAWITPTRNIWCRISPGTYGSGCQARNAPVPEGATCVNPTFTVDQLSKGFYLMPDRVEPSCFNQGVFTTEHPKVLQYEHTVHYQGYSCTSRTIGMTCTNGTGHGFELSMQTARSF
ncbi:DUF6636 domain-containing protein [Rhodococcus erythropolis]